MTDTFKAPYEPIPVSDVDIAFPANIIGKLLPAWKDIPEEFRDRHDNPWCELANRWFCVGLNYKPPVKEGLSSKDVWRHLFACIGSFEPKHEHKIAGVGYLMSLWLTEPTEQEMKRAP